MRETSVHQFVVGATPGDAIFDQAVILRDWLRQWGHPSEIYAHMIHPSLVDQTPHYTTYRSKKRAKDVLIFHHSIGSELSEFIRNAKNRIVMIYHNVTPPELLGNINPQMRAMVKQGQDELGSFRDMVKLALADSEFNRLDLLRAGYSNTGVLPIILNESSYNIDSDPMVESELKGNESNILFLGRIAPNKCQDDVIKAFYHYHLINPTAHLYLVGQIWKPAEQYYRWLLSLVSHLGLESFVHFTDHVNEQQMITYYRGSNLFLCMSEHEGFGKPLIESMYFDLPIIAYSSSAIPYTLNDAGVLIHQKDYTVIAELMNLLLSDGSFREKILEGQRRRYVDFQPDMVKAQFGSMIKEVIG